jgi:hypothetical protein
MTFVPLQGKNLTFYKYSNPKVPPPPDFDQVTPPLPSPLPCRPLFFYIDLETG